MAARPQDCCTTHRRSDRRGGRACLVRRGALLRHLEPIRPCHHARVLREANVPLVEPAPLDTVYVSRAVPRLRRDRGRRPLHLRGDNATRLHRAQDGQAHLRRRKGGRRHGRRSQPALRHLRGDGLGRQRQGRGPRLRECHDLRRREPEQHAGRAKPARQGRQAHGQGQRLSVHDRARRAELRPAGRAPRYLGRP